MELFFCAKTGAVMLEGDNIKDLNLGSLRDRIGIVGQVTC